MMTNIIQQIAEGEGDLSIRVDNNLLYHDESGTLGRWVNNFIDSQGELISKVKNVTYEVEKTNQTLRDKTILVEQDSSSVTKQITQLMMSMEGVGWTARKAIAAPHSSIHNLKDNKEK